MLCGPSSVGQARGNLTKDKKHSPKLIWETEFIINTYRENLTDVCSDPVPPSSPQKGETGCFHYRVCVWE